MLALKSDFPQVKLDIVSDGDIEYAKQLANELEVNSTVTFHSTKTTAEVAEMIQASHALLQFSNYENFPCVIAEAMMCGKPVLSSNVNGIPEHVNEINGMLVNRGDENALRKTIIAFTENPERFKSDEIRAYAMKHFSYSEVGKRFTEIYSEILNVKL
jgi:glycosyltransferase involved in cell wall biosynthesis